MTWDKQAERIRAIRVDADVTLVESPFKRRLCGCIPRWTLATILAASSVLVGPGIAAAQIVQPQVPSESTGNGGEMLNEVPAWPSPLPQEEPIADFPPANSKRRFRLRGRIDTDVIGTNQSPANRATFGDLGNAVGLRRARIGGQGEFGDSGSYIVEIDLASGFVVPRDVYFGIGAVEDGQRPGRPLSRTLQPGRRDERELLRISRTFAH